MLRRQACLSRLVLSQFCGLPEPGADCLLGSIGTLAWTAGRHNFSYWWEGRIALWVAERATNWDTRATHDTMFDGRSFGVEYLISFAQVPEAQGLYKVRVNGEIVHIMERDVKTGTLNVDFRSRRSASPKFRFRWINEAICWWRVGWVLACHSLVRLH